VFSNTTSAQPRWYDPSEGLYDSAPADEKRLMALNGFCSRPAIDGYRDPPRRIAPPVSIRFASISGRDRLAATGEWKGPLSLAEQMPHPWNSAETKAERNKEIIRLRDEEKLSFPQIADQLNRRFGTNMSKEAANSLYRRLTAPPPPWDPFAEGNTEPEARAERDREVVKLHENERLSFPMIAARMNKEYGCSLTSKQVGQIYYRAIGREGNSDTTFFTGEQE